MDAFESSLELSATLVQAAYRRLGPTLGWPPEIFDLAFYALRGGKSLRPALVFAVYAQLSESGEADVHPPESIIELGLALEMIHAYSLIHDDLPSMDNDDLRRGRPTMHRLVPEGRALLMGDTLLTGAFEVLAQSSGLSSLEKNLAFREIARAAGGAGMIGGQWWDLKYAGTPQFDQERDTIHRLKTGALFGAALALGVLGGARHRGQNGLALERALTDARQWGVELGLYFQLSDDLLDRDWGALGETALRAQALALRTKLSTDAAAWGGGAWTTSLLDFFLSRNI